MSESLENLLLNFAKLGRPDVYAQRQPDGSYRPVDGAFDLQQAKAQLSGSAAYGIYPLIGDQTQIAVVDLDDHAKTFPADKMLELAVAIYTILLEFGYRPILFRSGGGFGIHIWVFFGNRQRARVVRAFFKKILARCGLREGASGVEEKQADFFPKQDSVAEGGYGNLIALPFARESGWLNPVTGNVLKKVDFVAKWETILGPDVPELEQCSITVVRGKRSGEMPSDLEEVREALKHISAGDYDTWMKAMLALKYHFGDKGFDPWHEWSRTSQEKYKGEDDCRKKWAGANPNGRLGLGSVFHWAKEKGWNGPANSMNGIIAAMNERFGIFTHGSKTLVIVKNSEGQADEDIVLLGLGPFFDRMAPETISMPDGKGGSTNVPIAHVWKQHPNAAHYYKLDFDPALPSGHNGKVWNTYVGLAFDPMPGEWGKFRNHLLEVVCDGREDLFEWLMNWLALGVQKPAELIGTALVLKGPPGTGKGIFANVYGRLWGPHYISITQAAHVLGRFNSHLASKRLIFIDEGSFGGNRKEAGVIKTRVTEPYVVMEQKGVDPIRMKNFSLVILASNEDSVVPADTGDRRWMVFDVNKARKEDRAHFGAIMAEMKNGGYEAMLYDLLHRDVTKGPDPHQTIKTEALFDEILRAQPPYVQYVHLILHQGRLPQNLVAGADTSTIRALLEDMRQRFPTEKRLSEVGLGQKLKKIIPAIKSDKNGEYLVRFVSGGAAVMETSTRHELPPLSEARQAFEAFVGVKVPWPEENTEWIQDPEVEIENEGQGNSPYIHRDPRFDGI
jgi:Family of unknown function (DUF5906)/Primase C terminal 2 (PriCT-2)